PYSSSLPVGCRRRRCGTVDGTVRSGRRRPLCRRPSRLRFCPIRPPSSASSSSLPSPLPPFYWCPLRSPLVCCLHRSFVGHSRCRCSALLLCLSVDAIDE